MMTTIAPARVSEKPIIFSASMVRAILEGRKTQTRRIVKPQPEHQGGDVWYLPEKGKGHDYRSCNTAGLIGLLEDRCRHEPGDRLWVREAFADEAGGTRKFRGGHIYYRADGEGVDLQGGGWSPSIYMPRWASRILLEVTGVRAERLQDISEMDARAEGCDGDCPVGHIPSYQAGPCAYHFAQIWEHINGPGSWDANPWVWCVSFRRIEPATFGTTVPAQESES